MDAKYKNIWDWYVPGETTREEFLEKIMWTRNPLTDAIGRSYPETYTDFFRFAQPNWENKRDRYIFQFWTKEFIDELASEIKKLNPQRPVEVGAGDGWLSKALRNRDIPIVATDGYKGWKFTKRHSVEKLDYNEAIKKYKPDLVLASWMPLGSNWIPDFKKRKYIKNIIVIGEGNGGCTGGVLLPSKNWGIDWLDNVAEEGISRTDYIMSFGEVLGTGKRDFGLRHTSVALLSRLNA